MRCKICSLKQDEHDKELWKFHQLNEICTWCGKKSWKHSLELWEIKPPPSPPKTRVFLNGFVMRLVAFATIWAIWRV